MQNFAQGPGGSPHPPEWTLRLYQQREGQIPFEIFRDSLKPYETEILDICIEEILARQGSNVCGTSWGKFLGSGLYEFRINRSLSAIFTGIGINVPQHFDPKRPIMLRIFFAVEGLKIVLLLSGYDKGKNPNRKKQQDLIKAARKLLKQHKQGY